MTCHAPSKPRWYGRRDRTSRRRCRRGPGASREVGAVGTDLVDHPGGPRWSSISNGPCDPVEAPPDGMVDVDDVVGDLRHQAGGVPQGATEDLPGELTLWRVGEHHLADVGRHAGQVGLDRVPPLLGQQVERLDTLRTVVEALARDRSRPAPVTSDRAGHARASVARPAATSCTSDRRRPPGG